MPDPQRIRHQQDLDTPQKIDLDDTHPSAGQSDSDPQSAQDRKNAKEGRNTPEREQQEEILAANTKDSEASLVDDTRQGASRKSDKGLARSDRSVLRG